MKSAGLSDIGLHRKRNEDSYFIDEDQGIFIVCDGMGGHRGGDVASRLAVQTIREHLDLTGVEEMPPLLNQAVQAANITINRMGNADDSLREMGTTVTAAIIRDNHLTVAHVGDSSLYYFHTGTLSKITRDHTLAAQMKADGIFTNGDLPTNSYSHILTRAVGVEAEVSIDIYQQAISRGDWILICSDGLTDLVTDVEIAGLMVTATEPAITARALLDTALDKGGYDNITVIVVSI
ncbi:MAG: Stp1/IreP family PP2C-type Ser/Thr phosphatase [Syntrophomonadaceae bacterium]